MTDMTGAVRVRLAEFRKKMGLTQEKFADRADISRQTVIKLEGGLFTAIESETILKISDLIGSLDWLEYTPQKKTDEASQ